MRNLLSLCLIAVAATSLFAQEGMDGPKPSSVSRKYAEYRLVNLEPKWGLAKIKTVVKGLKEDQDMNRKVTDQVFNSWNVQEKFTYTMIHGEDFSQNCDMMPQIVDEEKKVFSHFPGAFNDEATWSERQIKFMEANRTKVIELMKTTIVAKNRVGNNFKHAIWNLNAVELIPTLVTVYSKDKKDHDILTVLLLLMKDNKFPAFLKTSTYKKLFGEEDNWRSYVMASPALYKETIGLAGGLYKSKKVR